MIARYALFQGIMRAGAETAFRDVIAAALAGPARTRTKTGTAAVVANFFTGKIHDEVGESRAFALQRDGVCDAPHLGR